MVVKQTTTIKASITAYSTAVGPSSLCRKRLTRTRSAFIAISLFGLTDTTVVDGRQATDDRRSSEIAAVARQTPGWCRSRLGGFVAAAIDRGDGLPCPTRRNGEPSKRTRLEIAW
jgi:hypothetical protein